MCIRDRLRTVPPVAAVTQQAAPPVPEDGAPYVQASDLDECAGLALGSPTRFGNMAAPMKHFIDGLGAVSYTHLDVYKRQAMAVSRFGLHAPACVCNMMCGGAPWLPISLLTPI